MSVELTEPMPLEEAVESLSERTPIGSVLRTSAWVLMPQVLRQKAFFSATVESVRFLADAKRRLLKRLSLEKTGEPVNRARFIGDLREMADNLGLRPSDPLKREGLQDIGSVRRLELIWDTQIEMAEGYAKYKQDAEDEDILDAVPAQELVRVSSRVVPRDWRRRWADKGGKFYGGRMIALKSDGIWSRMSRFGQPWPPFDFNSGMGLRDVLRDEAEDMGLLKPDEPVSKPSFEPDMEASVRGLGTKERDILKRIFGGQVDITDETIKWKGDL